MEKATAQLNNLRMSPRKVRLVANFMRGKRVDDLFASLKFIEKAAGEPLQKLLQSAVANARNLEIETDNLVVSGITVNSGAILYRSMPTARGRAFPLRKRTSKITIVVSKGAERKVKNRGAKAAKIAKKEQVKEEK